MVCKARDQDGKTAAHVAAAVLDEMSLEATGPCAQGLRLLLRAKANPDAVDHAGGRPVHEAARTGQVACLEALQLSGADLKAVMVPRTEAGTLEIDTFKKSPPRFAEGHTQGSTTSGLTPVEILDACLQEGAEGNFSAGMMQAGEPKLTPWGETAFLVQIQTEEATRTANEEREEKVRLWRAARGFLARALAASK